MAGSLPRPAAGLLFDMGDVLYDATAWRRWLLQLLTRLGLHTNYTCLFRVWDREFLDDVHRGRREFCEAFDAFLRALGLRPSQIDEVGAACRSRRRRMEATARPLPGVKATLFRLHRAGLTLGILNNSERSSAALRRQLEQFGVADVFTSVISSIELGQVKPAAATYLASLRQMGLRPEQAAFVGHDSDELAGAAEVGMATIAFNFDDDAKADVRLERFEQLLDVIDVPARRATAG